MEYVPPKCTRLQVSDALLSSVRRTLELWGDWVGQSQHAGSAHWSDVLALMGYIERPQKCSSHPGDKDDTPLAVDRAVSELGLMDTKAQWVVLIAYTMPGSQGSKANVAGVSLSRYKALLHSGELFVAARLLKNGVIALIDVAA